MAGIKMSNEADKFFLATFPQKENVVNKPSPEVGFKTSSFVPGEQHEELYHSYKDAGKSRAAPAAHRNPEELEEQLPVKNKDI